jgi:phage shock protein C
MNRRLYKSQTERVISGVAGGVAEYLDADPAIVRVIWALLAIFTGGVFFVLYIVMWIVVPLGPYPAGPEGGPEGAPGGEAAEGASGQPGSGSPTTWNAAPPYRHRHRRGSGEGAWVFGLILIGVGLWFLAREYIPAVNFDRLWPLGLVLVGVLFLAIAIRRRPE